MFKDWKGICHLEFIWRVNQWTVNQIFEILSLKLRSGITYYLYAWTSATVLSKLRAEPCLVFVPCHFLIKPGHPGPCPTTTK